MKDQRRKIGRVGDAVGLAGNERLRLFDEFRIVLALRAVRVVLWRIGKLEHDRFPDKNKDFYRALAVDASTPAARDPRRQIGVTLRYIHKYTTRPAGLSRLTMWMEQVWS
jgi:hypothetical protein